MKLLADSSAILALVLRKDRNHARAVAFVRDNPQTRFVVTELVLAEVATRMRARAGAERSVAVACSTAAATSWSPSWSRCSVRRPPLCPAYRTTAGPPPPRP